jgi:hypothetical protein
LLLLAAAQLLRRLRACQNEEVPDARADEWVIHTPEIFTLRVPGAFGVVFGLSLKMFS